MDKQPREIIFGTKVQAAIDRGVTTVFRAVATTLGSKGRNVGIEKNWGAPIIIHDGVTVARDVVLSDQFANMAAQSVIAAAQDTNNQAGDGTTTATILTYAIVKEGLKQIAANEHPQVLRKGIERAAEIVIAELEQMAKPVKTHDEMQQVATISAASSSLGELIAKAVEKVGRHGVVTVQEGQTNSIEVEYKEGMEFQQGYINPYMITTTEGANGPEAVLKGVKESRPFIVIIDDELTQTNLFPILERISMFDKNAKILLIANSFEPDAVGTLVVNRLKANKVFIGVKSPEFGDHRTQLLHDIATVTGGTVIGGTSGIAFSSINDLSPFGRADKIIVNREQTMIIGGGGGDAEVKKQIAGIKKQLVSERNEFKRDKLEARLAKLIGGVAVISVGANSETEMKELKERVYDAVNATKAALEMGIVPGGGVSMVRASKELTERLKTITIKDAEVKGVNIVRDALTYPLIKLVENAGGNSGFVLQSVLNSKDSDLGYNVDTEQLENMIESGIIDPLKVTISAFKNAVSTATMLLTMDCMISLQREQKKDEPMNMEGIGSFSD